MAYWFRQRPDASDAPLPSRSDGTTAKLIKGLRALGAMLLAVVALSSVTLSASQVCRTASFEGMQARTESIHRWLGADTRDPSQIRLYVSRDGDNIYIQSNFLSENLGEPGTYSEFPTKLRLPGGTEMDVSEALTNIMYWAASREDLPADYRAQVARALDSAEIYVDTASLGADGRPSIDLTGVGSIRLARDSGPELGGVVELQTLNRPPPALTERLAGCCFSGRPPGLARQLTRRLQDWPMSSSDTNLLSLVVDSGTASVIGESPLLSQAAARNGIREGQAFSEQIDSAIRAASGRNLVVLSHVEGSDVVIRNAAQSEVYRIPIAELNAKAEQGGARLVLFGCETGRYLEEASIPLGVIGTYNTAYAARRMAAALQNSRNGMEFLSAVTDPQLRVVAQAGNWSPRAIGTAIYHPPSTAVGRAKRLFRIWFLGGR